MTSITITELQRDWTSIVGPLVSAVSWPLMVSDGGHLVVGTASANWKGDLEKRIPEIIAALPPIDGNTVTSIRWVYTPPTAPARRSRPGWSSR